MNTSSITRQSFLWDNGKAWLYCLKMKEDLNGQKIAKTQKSKNTWNAEEMLVRLEKGVWKGKKKQEISDY